MIVDCLEVEQRFSLDSVAKIIESSFVSSVLLSVVSVQSLEQTSIPCCINCSEMVTKMANRLTAFIAEINILGQFSPCGLCLTIKLNRVC